MSKKIELELCSASKDEGIGSIYERIMVKRFLEKVKAKYKIGSILEYKGIQITKGYDNYIFTDKVPKIDALSEKYKVEWPFERKIRFVESEKGLAKSYDLVWNFATLQASPEVLPEMTRLTDKYLLIFVPNVWNWGTPFHIAYHLIFRDRCEHAERGKFSLKTRSGLKKAVRKAGFKILETDYIDMPWIPDIGFSIRELKTRLGMKVPQRQKIDTKPEDTLAKIESMKIFEGKKWLGILKPIVSHHQYVLAEKKR